MKSTSNSIRHEHDKQGWLRTTLICALVAGQARAQGAGKKPEPAQMQAATASAVTDDPADWGQTASRKPSDNSFVIGADDVLTVNVWKEPDVSRSVPVRSDGKITLPLVGELQAGGQTPRQLEKEIATKLKSYISEPEVTVMVQEVRSQRFNVLGQVSKPGSYLISNSARVLDAIAVAGGFRDFAKKKSIYVLRRTPDGGQTRLSFNYSDVIKGKNPDQNVELKPHDTVVVP
jgi:polysaccharide export outer membrane protein